MANTLGSLVVNLGLNAAEFTGGLTKAEYQAKQFAQRLETGLRASATVAAGALALVGAAALAMAKDAVSSASALDDLADATGSSVESLSKLTNQAKIAGVDFATLEGLMLKLSVNMGKAEDETSDVARALKTLGVTTRDPAEAMQQIAVELAKYADGIEKVSFARALFDKAGPAHLALLKDIAEMQDVLATVTKEQAAESEKLEKATRRLGVEFDSLVNPSIFNLVKSLNDVIEKYRIAGEAGAGFSDRLRMAFFSGDAAELGGKIEETTKRLAELKVELARFDTDTPIFGNRSKAKEKVAAVEAELRALIRLQNLAFNQQAEGTNEFVPGGGAKPKLPLLGNDEKVKAAAKAVSLYADALRDMKAEAREESDALKENIKAHERNVQALLDQAEAETKARNAAAAAVDDYALQNDILARQVAIIGESEAAQQKLAAAVDYEARKRAIANTASEETLAKLDAEYAKRLKLIDSIEASNKALEEQRKQKQFIDDIGAAFGNAAEDALVFGGTAKDVLKGLEQDLRRILTRKTITEPLGNAISDLLGGGKGGGGDWLTTLLKAGMSYFTGGSGAGWTPGYDLPMGGYANGTNFARGGMAIVGERGPEAMFVPRGAQIIPNERLVSMREERTESLNVTVQMPRGASRQTGTQFGMAAAREIRRGGRNG